MDTTQQSNAELVDLHVHVFPPRMFTAVWDYFEQRSWAVHRQQAEQVVRTLADHGVGRAVALSYPHKPGVARPLNRFMERLGQRVPLLLPFASVHVEDAELRQDVDHVLASPHLHGFKFQPLVQRFDLNDPRLDYLYQGCLEQDFPLLIHAGTAPLDNQFVGHEHFARLMRRFEGLRVCVAHMGGYEYDAFLALLEQHPRMYLDSTMINTPTDLFDTAWRGDADLLRRHADRVCFGSDWPNVPYAYQDALDSLARFPFEPEQLPGIMGSNALRFLGMS